MGLLEEARKNPAVEELYQEIHAQTPVTFTEQAGNDEWSSQTMGGTTSISGTPTAHPDAAMAHELLHAKLKIGGYKQYCTTTAMNMKYKLANTIARMLDNELQHHKMFGDFLAMGFQPEQFYHDGDTGSFQDIRRRFQGMRSKQTPEEFFWSFVTVIAPGGVGADEERRKLKALCKAKCSAATWKILCDIEQEIAAWVAQPSLDAGDTIVKIFQLLGGYDSTWVGCDATSFPASGHFIGQPFTEQQVEAWFAKNA